jgi:hypothetical protein
MKWRLIIPVVLVGGAAAAWIYWPGYKPTWVGGPEPLPSPTMTTIKTRFLPNDRYKFTSASSAPVEMGVEYQYTTGHCGLSFLVDFDGSFWIPEDVPGDGPKYYYNEDEGTMTLVSEDEALYLSSDSQETTLTRHVGSITVKGLCA